MYKSMKFSGFLIALLALSACGDRNLVAPQPPKPPLPAGKEIDTPAFRTAAKTANGDHRIRLAKSTTAKDRAALAAFDGPAANPAGYLDLMAEAGLPKDLVQIEVIAEVDQGSGRAKRLLRLTADQRAFVNVQNGQMIESKGQYYFRGQSFAWVTIDDRPMLSGYHSQGLESMMVDFDRQTASIDLRTEVAGRSEVEIEIRAKDLPFNIRSGAFGGPVTIALRDPQSPMSGQIPGSLRGNIGGTPGYQDGKHALSATGMFTGRGEISDPTGTRPAVIDGVFFGTDVNAPR